uniref:Uncharacterized protein n=1 Tax=Anguilla anguilla TaxID=7936 RepID=A0A0E9SRE3_ANGAN
MNSLFHTSSSLFLFIPSDFPPSCPSYFSLIVSKLLHLKLCLAGKEFAARNPLYRD